MQRKYWSEVTKRRIAAEQKFQCALCHQLLGPTWVADHRIPLHKGGSNSSSNCDILCVECHALKTQQEMIRLMDQRREIRTGQSKYWDPQSINYVEVKDADQCKYLNLKKHSQMKSSSILDNK